MRRRGRRHGRLGTRDGEARGRPRAGHAPRAPTIAACVAALALALAGCASPHRPVHALDGHVLPPLPVEPEKRAELAAQTAEARAALEAAPGDEDAYIWLGRRIAYEAHYPEAIDVFTEGLALHPDSHRLLRHRGHRWITVRELDRAVEDLERARDLAAGLPDEVEPDGAPNAAGIPRSTMKGNIHYHLGLAYYLLGRFGDARDEWLAALDLAGNDDAFVSAGWWLVLTARRLGDDFTVAGVLGRVRRDMEILENHAYHELLLTARGELAPHEVLPESFDSIEATTRGYGLAALDIARGDSAAATALLRRIVEGPWWPAFGHIAAEAELWRAEGRPRRVPRSP